MTAKPMFKAMAFWVMLVPVTAGGALAEGRYVVKADEAPTYIILGGKGGAKLLLDRDTVGAQEAYLGLITFLPGTVITPHTHETAELLYVLEGQGELTIADQVIQVKGGMAIYVPRKTEHSFKVSTEVLSVKAIQVYAPPGPEQRFKAGKRVEE